MEDQWNFVCSVNATNPALIEVNHTSSDRKKDDLSETTISYSDMYKIVEKFRQEIGSNQPTTLGICLPCFSTLESSILLACLCEEAWIYVPIDPSLPMRNQIQLLLQYGHIDKLVTYASSPLGSYLDSSISHLNVSMKKTFKVHESMTEIVLYQLNFPLQKSTKLSPSHTDILYILFTSGSTGKPKGVIGSRKGTWKRLEWMWQTFPFDPLRDIALRCTKFSFVDSIWEIAGPLMKGIPLVHIQPSTLKPVKSIILEDLSLFFQVLSTYRVTRLTMIPSVLDIVLTVCINTSVNNKKLWLEYVLVSGEVFPCVLALKAIDTWKKVTFLNLYGSTEVCGDITWYPIQTPIELAQRKRWQKYGVPIGRKGQCIGDSTCRLLGNEEEVEEEGEKEGEIQVTGSAVALGYVEEDGKMVQFQDNNWFSTGDIGRFVDDELFFCGRNDQRIKVHGQWVNLLFMERLVQEALDQSSQAFQVFSVIQSFLNDQELLVIVRKSKDIQSSDRLNESQVLTFLAKQLHLYGLPWMKIHLKLLDTTQQTIPLLPNGKLNRQVLVQMISSDSMREENSDIHVKKSSVKVSNLEKTLRNILGLKGLSKDLAHQTFEQLGGNSLLASLVVWEFQQTQPLCSLRPEQLLQGKTIEDIVASMIQDPSLHLSTTQDIQPPDKKQRTSSQRLVALVEATEEQQQEEKLNVVASFSRCLSSTWSNVFGSSSFKTSSRIDLKKRWQLDLSKCIDASPLIVQVQIVQKNHHNVKTLIYIGSHASRFVCVDFDTGEIVWEQKLDDRIEASAALNHSLGLLYVGTYGGHLYALHLLTGQLKWTFETQDQIKSSPCVLASKNLLICGSYDHTLYGIEAKTGICQWKVNLQGSIFATPIYSKENDTLYTATTKGRVSALSLIDGQVTPLSQWTVELPAPVFSSPALSQKYETLIIGCANAFIYSLSLLNGEIQWKIPTNKPIFSSPCIYEPDFMVIGCHDSFVRKIRLLDGHVSWETSLGGAPIFASPHVTSVVWVCTTTGLIYLCDIDTGRIIKSYEEPHGEIFSSPVALGTRCIVGTRSNQLLALDLKHGS